MTKIRFLRISLLEYLQGYLQQIHVAFYACFEMIQFSFASVKNMFFFLEKKT